MIIKMKLILLACSIIFCQGKPTAMSTTSQTDRQDFLPRFFNTSSEEVDRLVNNFEFLTVPSDQVNLLLYHSNLDVPTPLSPNNFTVEDSNLKIILIIHGWTSNGELPWINKLAQEYYDVHDNQNLSVIAVDWRQKASENYFAASAAVQSVGNITAEILWNLIEKKSSRLNNVHLIGHSLGAHVAGFVGKKIEELSSKKVDRITGLDAAGPLFTIPLVLPSSYRLSESDANFVDAYHTSIYLEGQANPAGQVDVYWNCGGPIQPGCLKYSEGNLLDASSCSHQSVHGYFAETIKNSRIYPVTLCSQVNTTHPGPVYSGESVTRSAEGMFCGSTVNESGEECEIFYTDFLNV